MKKALSVWDQHVLEWKDCQRCDYHEKRRVVVLGKGVLPCDVLFLGEAPGKSENLIGQPFVGPAGHLLDKMVKVAEQSRFDTFEEYNEAPSVRFAYTNLVGCIPLGEDGDKVAEPEPFSINACRNRVAQVYEMAQPKLVVCVGSLPAKWLDKVIPHRDAKRLDILHPAFILRMPAVQRGMEERRCEVKLADAFKECF